MSDTGKLFLEAIRKIEAGEMDLMGLISLAEPLAKGNQAEEAVVLYKFWLLANPNHPLRYAAAFNCGSQLVANGKLQEGKDVLLQSIAANPDFYPARLNFAAVQERMGDLEGAIVTWQAISARLATVSRLNIDNKVLALKNIARVRKGTAEAEAALREGIEIDPTQVEMVQHWVNNRQVRCIWPVFQSIGTLAVADQKEILAPLSACMNDDDPAQLREAAQKYVKQELRGMPYLAAGSWLPPANPKRDRLRIGYLSSDLCNHAIGYLMTDVFQHHNRDRYEILAYNIGARTEDPLQLKIMGQVDRWVDIKDVPDNVAATMLINDGIDILLDINGHTNFQRTKLLAMKPAPTIVNWLGYPGTIGSSFHDYIIADDFIIPPSHEKYYSEKVVRLPCYQPNGALQPIREPTRSRTELGLPDDAVVYCCFNGTLKITQQVFSRWMSILKNVQGSVLWLRGAGDDAHVQLRREAERLGVAGDRLIFLPFQSNTEYLASHRYADVFLDTFPYGAHTTGSDALRMGIPIVTLAGNSFQSRVCGSLSRSAGLPEMVCESPRQYTELAIALGSDRAQLQMLKEKLANSLPGCVLFDSRLLVRELEKLFDMMWAKHCEESLGSSV
jgi:predicted O-linked N-acetylglucosamine transferase (SPINDLY family)